MMDLFHNLIYLPLHNLLVFFVDVVPGNDLGLAVIAVTLLVKIVLMPLSLSAVKTQKAMKGLEPELKAIREKYKEQPEVQARETFALYKKYNVKPFASILMLFVQIPIIFGLYFVCQGAALTALDPSLLYSFIPVPESISPLFLGIFAVTTPSIVLALAAAVTQLAQAFYAIPVPPKPEGTPTMQEEFGRALAVQARFILPVVIGIFAYVAGGAIALYFVASNVMMLAQEFIVRGTHKPQTTSV
ncbi:MAG TPA: YidC/Oxa1 family membrane protein insertase [Candidatus Paceibacterota bacterium]|nr:YidC/Oxa1 family membrane protein insertase [Candidatus Paceibacterota bacterium]